MSTTADTSFAHFLSTGGGKDRPSPRKRKPSEALKDQRVGSNW